MKKYLLGFLFILSVVCFANGYGFDLETGSGYKESDYDEYGINKKTGQTREYEIRKAKEEIQRQSKDYNEYQSKIEEAKREAMQKYKNGEPISTNPYDEYLKKQKNNQNNKVMTIEEMENDPEYLKFQQAMETINK